MVKSPDVLVMIFDEVSSSKWNFYNRKSPARSIFTLILHAAYSFVPNCKVVFAKVLFFYFFILLLKPLKSLELHHPGWHAFNSLPPRLCFCTTLPFEKPRRLSISLFGPTCEGFPRWSLIDLSSKVPKGNRSFTL